MKLYTYQKELLNNNGNVYVNWCRGAGLTSALTNYILEKKPKKVLCIGSENYGVRNLLEDNTLDNFHYTYQYNRDTETIDIKFENTDDHIQIHNKYKRGIEYDLIITSRKSDYVNRGLLNLQMINYLTYGCKVKFFINNGNTTKTYEDMTLYDDTSYVDYKKALEVNQLDAARVIEASRYDDETFYNYYAILDEPKNETLDFEEFKSIAIGKLQTQFLDTADTKDTVLTRKNIIEMIKDLQSINN